MCLPSYSPSSPSYQIGCTKHGTQLGPSLASRLPIYSRRSPPSTFLPQFQWNNLVELLSEEHLVHRALRPSILVAQTRQSPGLHSRKFRLLSRARNPSRQIIQRRDVLPHTYLFRFLLRRRGRGGFGGCWLIGLS